MTLKEVIDSELREETNLNGTKEPKVTVYSAEGTLPHLHYKFRNVEGCVRLDIPRYFCHESYHEGLNNTQKKELISFLDENWLNCVKEWNKGRTTFICQDKEMPNYNLLPSLNPNGKLNKEDRK